ncbi:SdpI family protein [Candidatus Woesearchaeota archaeon]|nr:SdpI family protein [Candidatus Woesearchaeota archaeon]
MLTPSNLARRILLVIILVSVVLSIYFYPQFPAQIASHWNARGDVNGYMPKFPGLFLMPMLLSVLFVLFSIIPVIDPLKANIRKFREYFEKFIVLLFAFLLYIQLLTIIWNLGVRFDMTLFILPALALLFFYIGILMEKARRNWFIGIRTPWTMSSDKVWANTHRLGSKLYKLVALITIAGLFFRQYALIIFIVSAVSVTVITIVYSYIEYRR